MDCTSASMVMVFASWVTRVPGVAFALDENVDLDGDLLAAAHDQQVGVGDAAADRMQ